MISLQLPKHLRSKIVTNQPIPGLERPFRCVIQPSQGLHHHPDQWIQVPQMMVDGGDNDDDGDDGDDCDDGGDDDEESFEAGEHLTDSHQRPPSLGSQVCKIIHCTAIIININYGWMWITKITIYTYNIYFVANTDSIRQYILLFPGYALLLCWPPPRPRL